MTGGGFLGVSGSLTTRSSSFSTPPASSSFFSFFSSVPGLRLGFRGSGTSATTRTPYSSSNIGTGGSGVRSKTSASISALGRTSGTSILFSGEGFGAPAVSGTAGGVSKTIEIVGGSPSFVTTGMAASDCKLDSFRGEDDWSDLETDLDYWTKTLRPIQWYPGHIAKTEKELKDQLKLMDVVIEVLDARIPSSTSHPQMDLWLGNRKRILVLNREDMISTSDRNAWASYFARQGTRVVFSNGQLGMGSMKLSRLAKTLAADVNVKRRAKGLLPRAVRAGIVGYPNVGKSSLINRLLKRRMCPAASRPGVTRELKWVQFGKDLELLDSPGILPMRISNQSAAIKLAICDDIGERSYDVADVAAILVQMLVRIPSVGTKALYNRYRIETDGQSGQIFVHKLAMKLFSGDVHQAAFRILTDFRKGKFGWISLERPPS